MKYRIVLSNILQREVAVGLAARLRETGAEDAGIHIEIEEVEDDGK